MAQLINLLGSGLGGHPVVPRPHRPAGGQDRQAMGARGNDAWGNEVVGRWARGRGVNGLALMGSVSEPLTGLAALANTRVKVSPA